MATMEDRVTALEERVTRLEASGRHTADVAETSLEAHHHNVKLLNVLRETQLEHGAVQRKHGGMLGDHTFMLDDLRNTQLEHGAMLADHTRRLDRLASDMETVKGTVTRLTVGMDTLDKLIRRIVPDDETVA